MFYRLYNQNQLFLKQEQMIILIYYNKKAKTNMKDSRMNSQKSYIRRKHQNLQYPLLAQKYSQLSRQEIQRRKQKVYGLRDLSYHYEKQQQISRFEKLVKKVPVFNPESYLMMIWNILVQIAIVYNFCTMPLVVFFGEGAYLYDVGNDVFGISINIVFVFFLSIDIFIKFNMGFYLNEKLITNRKLIIQKYLRLQFQIDLICLVVYIVYLAVQQYDLIYVKLIFYLKLFSLIKIDVTVQKSIQYYKISYVLYKFARIVIFLLFFATWAASIFFAIDYRYYLQQDSDYYKTGSLWLINSQQVNSTNIIQMYPQWYIWYEYALYWSVQTSSTTGYGTIVGKNPQQIIYSNFVMLFMTVFFAYFINSVWEIIQNLKQSQKYNQKWAELKIYLAHLPFSYEEKAKINNCMIQVFKYEEEKETQSLIIQDLPQELKDQFYYQSRKRIFINNIYFPFLLDIPNQKEVIIKLAYLLEWKSAGEQQVIYQRNQKDCNLYYIKSGYVKLSINPLSKNKQTSFNKIVKKSQIFGYEQFILQVPRFHNAVADTFVKIWKLDYKKMKQSLKQQAVVNEHFFKFINDFKIYNSLPNMYYMKRCWKCETNLHFIYQCPFFCVKRQGYIGSKKQNITTQSNAERVYYNRINRRQALTKKLINIQKVQPINHNIDVIQDFQVFYKNYNLKNLILYESDSERLQPSERDLDNDLE